LQRADGEISTESDGLAGSGLQALGSVLVVAGAAQPSLQPTPLCGGCIAARFGYLRRFELIGSPCKLRRD